jgi:hypothetical protein
MPLASPPGDIDLDALGAWVEGRYRLTPRIYVAGRVDGLNFSRVRAESGLLRTWDAPVMRIEGNVGYYIQRNLIGRFAAQYNDRDGGRVQTRTYFSGQLAYWF